MPAKPKFYFRKEKKSLSWRKKTEERLVTCWWDHDKHDKHWSWWCTKGARSVNHDDINKNWKGAISGFICHQSEHLVFSATHGVLFNFRPRKFNSWKIPTFRADEGISGTCVLIVVASCLLCVLGKQQPKKFLCGCKVQSNCTSDCILPSTKTDTDTAISGSQEMGHTQKRNNGWTKWQLMNHFQF